MAVGDKNEVNSEFWLNLAAERVYGSMDKAALAAERLQKVIVWIFGVYSSITFAGVIWAKKEDWDPFALGLFGLAFALMIYSYFKANHATFPIKNSVNVNAPASIQTSQSETVTKVYSRLALALRLCAFGVFFYCAGILIQFAKPAYSLFGTKKEVKKEPVIGLDSLALVYHLDQKRPVLHLKLQSRKNSWVKLKLEWDTLVKKKLITYPVYKEKDVANFERWIYIDTAGVQHFSLPYVWHKNMYVLASRMDTLEKGSYKTHGIRKRIE